LNQLTTPISEDKHMNVELFAGLGCNDVIAVSDATPHTLRAGYIYFVCLNNQSSCNLTPNLGAILSNSSLYKCFLSTSSAFYFPMKISAVP